MKVGYARISTKLQNMARQIEALEAEGCRPIYHEVISGAKQSRPEWEKCKELLKQGDTLVVTEIDRIGRTHREIINTIDDLCTIGVRIYACVQKIDSTTDNGRLAINMLCALAENERNQTSERRKHGMEQARKRGVHGGRRYKHNFKTREEIRERYKIGWTYSELSERYSICNGTIWNYLKEKEGK